MEKRADYSGMPVLFGPLENLGAANWAPEIFLAANCLCGSCGLWAFFSKYRPKCVSGALHMTNREEGKPKDD